MMRTHRTAIDAIWRQGDVIEKLLWGKLFEELRLFEQSNQAFLAGLMREPRNIALLQSRARMLGAWAQTSSEKYEEARAVFGRAASIAPQNPYVWQAWGVMEAEHFNPQDAQNYFRRAWQAVRQGREQLYTLVAWANLAIEEGQRQQARRLLADAQTLFPQNFYIRHLDGKLAFYEGRYLEAETHLQAVLQLDHGNLPALNTLGYMALKRGHWYKAERYLTRALAIDPDNVPTVHALAEVWAERGELAAALGQVEEARKCFQEAEQRFTQLLELEPHNRYTQVAYGVMLGKWATYDPQRYAQAEHLLRTVFECDPRNLFAHHAQGELQLRLGAFDEAERLFRGIRSQNPRNFRAHLLALLALARLKTIQGLAPEARQFLEQVKRMVDDIRAGRIPLPPFHDLIRTYNTWAAIEAEAGEVERAGEIVREALSYDPENAYTCRLYAALLDRLGKTEEAQRSRERAAELTTAQ
jgi:tetratricopeptide (TPR) repeat protein